MSGEDWLTDMKLPSPYDGYPPKWSVLDQLGPPLFPAAGFKRDLAFARRFGARYRFACSVTEIVLKGYASGDTRAGYSALTRLAFTYSAFEAMLSLLGCPKKAAGTLLMKYDVAKWVAHITAIDPSCAFIKFVESKTQPNHEKTQIALFLAGKVCDVSAIAAAMRHVFFHGELTPNAGGVDPNVVCRICDYLIPMLVGVMDREIETRLGPLERKAASLPADADIPF
jgi:hypothetical protein